MALAATNVEPGRDFFMGTGVYKLKGMCCVGMDNVYI